MMNSNLFTLAALRNHIKELKILSMAIDGQKRPEITQLEDELKNMVEQYEIFTKNFSDLGWCVYESLDYDLVHRANAECAIAGIDSAERILLEYFKDDIKTRTHWIRKSSKEFSDRADLLHAFFDNHFEENYYSSVPLGLLIIDGAVNDFTNSKGFFAEGTDVDAWDSFVGSNESLGKLKTIFTRSRSKTNKEEIILPYRNGVLHGRDLNFGNEYVSCKCVALMFAVADWMRMKNSESERKLEFQQSQTIDDIDSQIKSWNDFKSLESEIKSWKKRELRIGVNVPSSGKKEDYKDYPYLNPLFELFESWEKGNYRKLSFYLNETILKSQSEGKRAGELREIFENKCFKSYEFISIEEKTYAKTEVLVNVKWEENGVHRKEELRFNCMYENIEDRNELVAPRRDNGEWTLIPLDIEKIFY